MDGMAAAPAQAGEHGGALAGVATPPRWQPPMRRPAALIWGSLSSPSPAVAPQPGRHRAAPSPIVATHGGAPPSPRMEKPRRCSTLRRRLYSLSVQQMATLADKLAFITGSDNCVTGVEGSIPVLVKSGNWIDTAEEIDDLFLGDAEVWRRPSFGTAGPLGGDHPLVTKEGHHVLDVIFTTRITDLGQVAEKLEKVGVVDHGIICSKQSYAVIASKGEVQVLDQKTSVMPSSETF